MLTIIESAPGLSFAREDRLCPGPEISFCWLGQAGFLFRCGAGAFMVDPYLSDFLAKKYAHAELKHVRLMPPPIQPQDVTNLDWLLCTHRHSDHMDPETLPAIMQNNPRCKVIAPAAERAEAAPGDAAG